MRFLFLLFLTFLSHHSKGQVMDTCAVLQKKAFDNRLKRTENSWPLITAGEIIIRAQELRREYIDTVFVLKCPASYAKFKNLAGMGIIYVKTTQSFETISVKEILESLRARTAHRNVIFAINGIFTDDRSIEISKKAIVKLDIFLNGFNADKHIGSETAVVNVWTITKKERRGNAKLPKLCRGGRRDICLTMWNTSL
jgi:hypothetical protein